MKNWRITRVVMSMADTFLARRVTRSAAELAYCMVMALFPAIICMYDLLALILRDPTAVLRIVSAEAFPLDPHITVTAFRGRSVAFCTLSDDPREGFCREYTLRDAMLANRLADYMSNLKDSSLVCTQRYTLEYIDFCLRLL